MAKKLLLIVISTLLGLGALASPAQATSTKLGTITVDQAKLANNEIDWDAWINSGPSGVDSAGSARTMSAFICASASSSLSDCVTGDVSSKFDQQANFIRKIDEDELMTMSSVLQATASTFYKGMSTRALTVVPQGIQITNLNSQLTNLTWTQNSYLNSNSDTSDLASTAYKVYVLVWVSTAQSGTYYSTDALCIHFGSSSCTDSNSNAPSGGGTDSGGTDRATANTDSSSATTTTCSVVKGKKIKKTCLVTASGSVVAAKSKVTLKVAKADRKVCKVKGTKVKGLKAGTCTVSVKVKPKKGKATTKTTVLTVT